MKSITSATADNFGDNFVIKNRTVSYVVRKKVKIKDFMRSTLAEKGNWRSKMC